MIGAPTTTADLFTQMAQAHFQKTASLVVQASDAYLMGQVAAHSPNLQLEMLHKQASAYEPQMSKVASGYVRFLEKLSHTDPERAYYLAKQAGIGSFLGRMAGGAARGGAGAARAVGRAGGAAGRTAARGVGAVRRGVGRATGAVRRTQSAMTAPRPGTSRFVGPMPAPKAPLRQRMGQRWQGFKQQVQSGYQQGRRAPAAKPSTPGFQGPMPAPRSMPAAKPSTPGFQGPMPAPAGRGGPFRSAAGARGPTPPTQPSAAPKTRVRQRRGMRGAQSDPSIPQGQMRDIMNPAPAGTRRATRRRGIRGAQTDPTLPQQQAAAPGAAPNSTVQRVRAASGVAGQAADLAPTDTSQQQQAAQQGFRFPWLKAGLLAGSIGVPMVAMKGMETAQNVLGSDMQSPYRAGQGAPQPWNRSYQF